MALLSAAPAAGQAAIGAPLGLHQLCASKADLDVCHRHEPARLLASEWLPVLRRVDADLRRGWLRTWDQDGDDWRVPSRRSDGAWEGDCEDFALYAYTELVAAGVHPGALKLARGHVQVGQLRIGHVLVIVDTTDGEWVIEGLGDGPMRRSEYPHPITKIQDAGLAWVTP